MAINLAGALGMKRTVMNPTEGIPELITHMGDQIQKSTTDAFQSAQQGIANKNKAKDVKDKELLDGIPKKTAIDATAEDQKMFDQTVDNEIAKFYNIYKDPNATPSQKQKAKEEFVYKIERDKQWLENDFKTVQAAAAIDKNKYGTGEWEQFLAGNPQPKSITGPPTEEQFNNFGNDARVVAPTQKPYFNMTVDERMNAANKGSKAMFNEKIYDKSSTAADALKAHTGQSDLGMLVDKAYVEQKDGKGKTVFTPDEEYIKGMKNNFLSSRGTAHDPKTEMYWDKLERNARIQGNLAGWKGEELNNFVDKAVNQVATNDIDELIKGGIRKKEATATRKDLNPENPRGGGITINNGGGGSSKIWTVGDGVLKPLYEMKDGKKSDKPIGDYFYHSIQTSAAGENPKKFNIGGYTDVQIEGVNVNKKTGKVDYIDITIPAKYNKDDELMPGTGIKKVVRIKDDVEVNNLRTNLGEELFDKTIGSHKPQEKNEVKKADDLRKKYNY